MNDEERKVSEALAEALFQFLKLETAHPTHKKWNKEMSVYTNSQDSTTRLPIRFSNH